MVGFGFLVPVILVRVQVRQQMQDRKVLALRSFAFCSADLDSKDGAGDPLGLRVGVESTY